MISAVQTAEFFLNFFLGKNFGFRAQTIASVTTGSPSSKYVVYTTACVYRELYAKIADRKKSV